MLIFESVLTTLLMTMMISISAYDRSPSSCLDGLMIPSELLKICLDIVGANGLTTLCEWLQEILDLVFEVIVDHDSF